MFTHQNNRDYPELVQTMISLKYIMNAITQNSSENMDIELQASIKQRKHIAQMSIEDTIIQIGHDPQLFVAFAFELRK